MSAEEIRARYNSMPEIKQEELSPYIIACAERDKGGIKVAITEINLDNNNCAGLAVYLPIGIILSAEQRLEYLKVVLEDLFSKIDILFNDCDKPDCPNCGGNDVTHI